MLHLELLSLLSPWAAAVLGRVSVATWTRRMDIPSSFGFGWPEYLEGPSCS